MPIEKIYADRDYVDDKIDDILEQIAEIGTRAEIVQAVIDALPDASEVSY